MARADRPAGMGHMGFSWTAFLWTARVWTGVALGVGILAGSFVPGAGLHAQDPSAAPPAGQTVVPDPAVFEQAGPTDDAELEAEVERIASQLRCPTCQALSIADSPSELSRQMEGVIRARLQEGMTPEQVRQSFVEAYGEWILLSPNPSGFNLLIYLLPVAVLLIGGGIVFVGVRRWLQVPAQEPPSTQEPVPQKQDASA